MAEKKISDLSENTTPATSVQFEIENSGVTERVSLANLLASTIADYQAADAAQTSAITALQTDRAQLVNPAFAGTPTVPTAAPGTSTTQAASTAFTTIADQLRVLKTGDTMSGALAMGTNKITGLGNGATATQDAATVAQMEAELIQRATVLDAYDPTATSAAPITHTTHAGTPLIGDRYRITVAGSISAGAHVLQIGDIIEANINTPGDTAGNWSVVQANSVQATTTVVGNVELATDAETLALADTTRAVTPSNLGALLATETQAGIREIATQAETDTGTSDTTFITPLKLEAKASTDYRKFLGIQDVLNYSAGTWTTTRVAQGDLVARKTAAANTTIISIDITKEFRTTSSRGFKLNSFDVIYRNTTADLVAHTITLDRISYTDTGIVTVTTVPLTGTLLLTQNANPRVTSIEVTTPSYSVGDKYVMELTVNAAATSVYDFIGIVLRFSQTLS